jgi:hypothetical protein
MQNTHKPRSQAKAILVESHFGMRFLEGIIVIALITFLAFMLTS